MRHHNSKKILHRLGKVLNLAALLIGAVLVAPQPAWSQTRPNVLVIMLDDLDLATWNEALRLGLLPHVQSQVLDAGTTFGESFVSQPLCCPSRATLLTGQYSHNHRVIRNYPPDGGFPVFQDTDTLPVWLQAAGYRTGMVGKYLNGYVDSLYVPPGYDTWNSLIDTYGTYCNYRYDVVLAAGRVQRYGTAPADYKTDVLAGLAAQFIDNPDPRPYFLLVAPPTPHYETCMGRLRVRAAPRHLGTVPDVNLPAAGLASFNEANMSDKPAWLRDTRLADPAVQQIFFNEILEALRSVDDMVGLLFERLRARGDLANTLVVITSDNGMQFGTHRQVGKRDLYEESIRVPLAVRAPGQSTPHVRQDWVLNLDLAPTIADYAQAPAVPSMDGRSLRPLLDAPAAAIPWRQTVLLEHPYLANEKEPSAPYFAVRSKSPALTLDPSGQTTLVYAHTLDWQTGVTLAVEFYDLIEDPLQLRSRHFAIAPIQQQRMSLMRERLEGLAVCRAEACRTLDQ